jgi:hypothetical protein
METFLRLLPLSIRPSVVLHAIQMKSIRTRKATGRWKAGRQVFYFFCAEQENLNHPFFFIAAADLFCFHHQFS